MCMCTHPEAPDLESLWAGVQVSFFDVVPLLVTNLTGGDYGALGVCWRAFSAGTCRCAHCPGRNPGFTAEPSTALPERPALPCCALTTTRPKTCAVPCPEPSLKLCTKPCAKSGLQIAEKELREKKIPFTVRRYLPDGSYEDWSVEELIQTGR